MLCPIFILFMQLKLQRDENPAILYTCPTVGNTSVLFELIYIMSDNCFHIFVACFLVFTYENIMFTKKLYIEFILRYLMSNTNFY